jgi:hypothetical protein
LQALACFLQLTGKFVKFKWGGACSQTILGG